MKIWDEAVRMIVLHPDGGGKLEVMAHTMLDARLQAAQHWNLPGEQTKRCKILVEKSALDKCREVNIGGSP